MTGEITISAAGLELAKLAMQFVGALIIAKLTVNWALDRFKTEKSWERKTTALAEVLAAMREMSRIVDSWIAEEIEGAHYSESHKEDLRQRYRNSRRQLESVAAVAILILPTTAANTLLDLEESLHGKWDNWYERLESEQASLKRATDALVAEAKKI